MTVVWEAAGGAGAPAVQARVDRFLAQAGRLEGIGAAGAPRVSRDGSIAMADLTLDRRAWDVPVATGEALIALAEDASGDGLRIALGGGPIMQAQDGGSPEGVGMLAAAVILLIAFGSVVAAGLPLAVALFGLGVFAPADRRARRGGRRAGVGDRAGGADRHRRRDRLRAAHPHPLPRGARARRRRCPRRSRRRSPPPAAAR